MSWRRKLLKQTSERSSTASTCSSCREIGPYIYPIDEVPSQVPATTARQWQDWRKSFEETGCAVCNIIVSAVSVCCTSKSGAEVVDEDELELDVNRRIIYLWQQDQDTRQLSLYISQDRLKAIPSDHLVGWPIRKLSCSGEFSMCLDRMTTLLHTCMKRHKGCERIADVTLPTRLIDIVDNKLKINSGKGQYVALSHRWQPNMPKTTSVNYAARLRGIAHTELPKLFLDAFLIARRFHVRYIWIDSLCIIQDSEDDKAEQCAKMADIYSNCLFCIAATDTKSLYYTPNHGGTGPFSLQTLSVVEEQGVSESPLGVLQYRGWCHQELFLAPRVIFFRPHELQWACTEVRKTCRESKEAYGLPENQRRWRTGLRAGASHETDLFALWRNEVESYSNKDFSFTSDRLPAFSGMTRRFISLGVDSQYLAGMWLHDVHELCWSTEDQGDTRRLHAPSFSWASVDGRVSFQGVKDPVNVKIIAAHCQPATADEYGAVSHGYISLSGLLLSGHISWDQGTGIGVAIPGLDLRLRPDITDHKLQAGLPCDLLSLYGVKQSDLSGDRLAFVVLQRSGPDPDVYSRRERLHSYRTDSMPLITSKPTARVILGTMTFGPDPEKGARVTDLAAYNSVLDKFQAAGYNEIDTARVYVGGKQEAFTREAKWKERGLTVATKWYPFEAGAHQAAKVEEKLNESLRELGTDCVDIFYLHAADRATPFQETLAKLDELHKQGKFVQLGLSNFTAFEVAEVAMHCKYHGWVRPTIYQGMYNAITRSIEAELIPACRRYGLDIVVYNPIAGGLFSGKYKTSEVPKEGRYSDSVGTMGGMYRKRYFRDSTFEALRIIEPVVQKHNLTLLETAFRWLVHHSQLKVLDGNDGIIIGVSSEQQLVSNLKDIEKGPLPEDVLKALDEAWLVTKPETANYWHLDLKYAYDTRKALFDEPQK